MYKPTQNRASPVVHVQDLVLDQQIDNSLSQSLSFYGVTPASAPYPHHLFSPNRAASREYSLSRDLKARFIQLDDYTDTLSAADESSPIFKNRKVGDGTKSEDFNGFNSSFATDDETSLSKYIGEIAEAGAEKGAGVIGVPLKKKTSKQKNMNSVSNYSRDFRTVLYHCASFPRISSNLSSYFCFNSKHT